MTRYKDRPCPGCGELRPLAPQTLCGYCRYLLEQARRAEQTRTSEIASGEKIVIALGGRWRYGKGLPVVHGASAGNRMIAAIARITGAERLSFSDLRSSAIRFIHCSPGDYSSPEGGYRVVTPGQADALQELGDAIAEWTVSLVQAARQEEQSFLVKLASGEATVQDYEKRVIK